MHQPYYKDDLVGEYVMPWVFLHGIKDYYELPWLSASYNIKSTYNLVPSLMIQLQDYGKDLSCDSLLKVLLKRVEDLDEGERKVVCSRCFESHAENMIAPIPRYFELFNRRESHFSNSELIDLQVLFLLSWCGNYLREENEVVINLLKKGRDFSHDDKCELLERLRVFIGEILEKYAELEKDEKISIFTTPFYHPITPILLDPNSAKEADDNTAVAEISADFTPHGHLHTENAVKLYKELFNKEPKGFWPAEGAVSQKGVSLFARNGIKYVCTDEEILFKSKSNLTRNDLYKPYKFDAEGNEITMLFRDKPLSDLIGFTYSNIPATTAVDEFIERLRSIKDSCEHEPTVSVFLDGENAWEYYPDNAYEFFTTLYERLGQEEWIETLSVDEACEKESGQLNRLKPGSWIGGNLNTWMGHSEKNQGWELLSATYQDYRSFESELNPEVKAQIEKELFIAEGSDWFWWYGDDHYTHLAGEFDALFRKHLQNVYTLANREIPKDLFIPIKEEVKEEESSERVPSSLISPIIDGGESGFYEWMGAGKKSLGSGYSVMDSSGVYLLDLEYGIDRKNLYLRVKPEQRVEGKVIELHFVSENNRVITIDLQEENSGKSDSYNYVYKDFLEISVDRADFCVETKADIYFVIKEREQVIQRAPLYKSIELELKSGHDAFWYI